MVTFVTQAQSTQEAKACLNAVITEVSNNQDAIAKPMLMQIKQKIQLISEQLKLTEEIAKISLTPKGNSKTSEAQFASNTLYMSFGTTYVTKISDFRSQISTLESAMIAPQTRPVVLASSVYAPEVYVNKRPFITFLLCLALGVFVGLFLTGVMRVAPRIRLQMRKAEGSES